MENQYQKKKTEESIKLIWFCVSFRKIDEIKLLKMIVDLVYTNCIIWHLFKECNRPGTKGITDKENTPFHSVWHLKYVCFGVICITSPRDFTDFI